MKDSWIRDAQQRLAALLSTPKFDDLSEATLREALDSLDKALAARPAPEPLDVEEFKRRVGKLMSEYESPGWFWAHAALRIAQLAASHGASLDEIVAAAKGASQ